MYTAESDNIFHQRNDLRYPLHVERRRRWKSDTSEFVIVDGNVTWNVLEG